MIRFSHIIVFIFIGFIRIFSPQERIIPLFDCALAPKSLTAFQRDNNSTFLHQIAKFIDRAIDKQKGGIVFIDGQSGSGKSTFARNLEETFNGLGANRKIVVLYGDAFALLSRSIRYPIKREILKYGGSYYSDEEKEFFSYEELPALLEKIRHFFDQDQQTTLEVQIPNKDPHSGETVGTKETVIIKKGDIVVLEFKYAMREELRDLAVLRFRIDIGEKENREQFVGRHGDTSEYAQWFRFGLTDSFYLYRQRTFHVITGLINPHTEEALFWITGRNRWTPVSELSITSDLLFNESI